MTRVVTVLRVSDLSKHPGIMELVRGISLAAPNRGLLWDIGN